MVYTVGAMMITGLEKEYKAVVRRYYIAKDVKEKKLLEEKAKDIMGKIEFINGELMEYDY